MYLKQLEWTKWSAADEIRRQRDARSAAAAVVATPIVTPATPPAEADLEDPVPTLIATTSTNADAPMTMTEIPELEEPEASTSTGPSALDVPRTPPPAKLPPVTPSKHVATAQAKARAITPPLQPRKTPMARRVAVDPDSDDELGRTGPATDGEGAEEETDVLPALGVTPPAGTKTKAKPRSSGGRARGGTASERPARVTRSALAGPGARKPPLTASPTKATAGIPSPNKIPRLAANSAVGAVTRAAAKAAAAPGPSSRRVPPPTPSRLPTLATRRHQTTNSVSTTNKALTDAANNIGKPGGSDAWMKQGKGQVVVPASKNARPGLRPIRRRRSSFSAADVVA
jgi:cell division cycle 14